MPGKSGKPGLPGFGAHFGLTIHTLVQNVEYEIMNESIPKYDVLDLINSGT